MKKFFVVALALGMSALWINELSAWDPEGDPKAVSRINKKLEKMMPALEKQVELIVKMVGNDKYLAKLDTELAEVGKNQMAYQRQWVDKNEGLYASGKKLSFLASVLKKYKVPLKKTCISTVGRSDNYPLQPLGPDFLLAFLGGSMFSSAPRDYISGIGIVDMRTVGDEELIRMSQLAGQILELQKLLRDGIEGKLESTLEEFEKYSSSDYIKRVSLQKQFPDRFLNSGMAGSGNVCDWYSGKTSKSPEYWPTIGYHLIIPGEILAEGRLKSPSKSHLYDWRTYFIDMPVEYTQVWRDMNSFYVDYIGEPLFGDNMNPYFDVLDDILAKKVEEPLGDLMSEDSDTDKTDTSTDDDDDGLALPSLD